MDDKLYPLLGTVVGGLLTVCGGWVLAAWNRSGTHRLERNKVVREKLEEAGELARQAVDWADEMFHELASSVLGGNMNNLKERKVAPIKQLSFLTKVYCPELSPVVTRFIEQVESFHKSWTEFLILPTLQPGAKQDSKTLTVTVSRSHDGVAPAYDKLVEGISDMLRTRYL